MHSCRESRIPADTPDMLSLEFVSVGHRSRNIDPHEYKYSISQHPLLDHRTGSFTSGSNFYSVSSASLTFFRHNPTFLSII
jgi:hypothetical protein